MKRSDRVARPCRVLRRIPLACISIALLPAVLVAGQTTAYEHEPARVPVGTTWEYAKSNLDGTQAIRVIARLSAVDRLDVLKLEPENEAAAYVRAWMDWGIASAIRLESEVLFPDGTRRPQASLILAPDTRLVSVEVFGVRDSLRVGVLPVHMYNFDFLSLAAALPHLVEPDAGFTIGIMNPTFAAEPPVLRYDGEARVEFEQIDDRGGIRARRYRLEGGGLGGSRLWTAEEDGRLLAFESPVPDNPGWSSFRLELRAVRAMTDAEWEAFRESEVAALARGAGP